MTKLSVSTVYGHAQSVIRDPEFPDTCKKFPVL
jgi:hypothetical protein